MTPQKRRATFLLLCIVALLAIAFPLFINAKRQQREQLSSQPPLKPSIPVYDRKASNTNIPAGILEIAKEFGRKPAALLTEDERADLQATFPTHIKPTIQKWCAAYQGHLPFSPEDVTLDRFVEVLARERRDGRYAIYTFVVDGVTLCVESRVTGQLVVNYLYAPQAKNLMNLPAGTVPPSLKMPLERTKVIDMISDDTGVRFHPSEMTMRPAGLASALNGGAIVDVPLLRNGTQTGFSKVSMVFDQTGTLCYYDRDPTF